MFKNYSSKKTTEAENLRKLSKPKIVQILFNAFLCFSSWNMIFLIVQNQFLKKICLRLWIPINNSLYNLAVFHIKTPLNTIKEAFKMACIAHLKTQNTPINPRILTFKTSLKCECLNRRRVLQIQKQTNKQTKV